MPGPVQMYDGVLNTLSQQPISHRSDQFSHDLTQLKNELCHFTNAEGCVIMNGSGTLANEVIGVHLKCIGGKGIILSNGEFGERLQKQGNQLGLNFIELTYQWNTSFDLAQLNEYCNTQIIDWVWFVHCETSTGMMNPLKEIVELVQAKQIKVCVDCMSSIANVALDLSTVYLASASSNKGLASIPGLALLFYNDLIEVGEKKSMYLDVFNYINKIPYTISTNVVYSLVKSLSFIKKEAHSKRIINCSGRLKTALQSTDLELLEVNGKRYNPTIFTLKSNTQSSIEIGDRLAKKGVYIHYKSDYLLKNNCFQVCIMGKTSIEAVDMFIEGYKKCYFSNR